MHQLTRRDARRIAVRAQLLSAPRPTDLEAIVHHLTRVKIDPIAAVAPSELLILWSRLGSAFDPDDLRVALDEQAMIEHQGFVRPTIDMRLYRAEMDQFPGSPEAATNDGRFRNTWVTDNDACRRDLLERLRADGPLTATELPDTCVRPWRSTGWTNHKNVQMMLETMVRRGEVVTVGRRGQERLWDLAERVYPDEIVPLAEALRERDARRLGALGIARTKAPQQMIEPRHVGQAGEAAVVEGVRGHWRIDPSYLDEPFRGRVALLAPFDGLIEDRKRMAELFEFDYILEMYKPRAQRKWGYYALPILAGDRLVGKLDATADHRAGVLRVDAIHADVPFSKATTAAIHREIRDLARWLGLDVQIVSATAAF